jgi:hypothetical protein
MTATSIRKEDYGTDNGHDFRVVKQRGNEVLVEYLSDGKRAWFQKNRFRRDGTSLELI